MARKNRIMLIACMALIVMLALAVTAAASSQGSIFLKLPEGMEVTIYKVADYDGGKYTEAVDLSQAGLDVEALVSDPSAAAAASLQECMAENDVTGAAAVSHGGYAKYSGLAQGIWLVCADEVQQTSFKPFLVFIPHVVDGVTSYTVWAEPKMDESDPQTTSIYVMKRWDDSNNAAGKRPESITVYLMLDGEAVTSAQLNKQNAWSHTFDDLKKSDGYSVEEKNVDYYKAKYSGDQEDGFVITNVYHESKLPQTGDDWGPVVIILIGALACMALCVIKRKERKAE